MSRVRKNHTLALQAKVALEAAKGAQTTAELASQWKRQLLDGAPELFASGYTVQGAQFTARAFTSVLEASGVRISMDRRGRCLDNVFIERLWRGLKYEDVHLRDYRN